MILPYYQHDKKGIIMHLKVTSNAPKNDICGVMADANGQQILKVKVTALAEDGQANKAIVKLLAKELAINVSSIEIISGKTSQRKKLLITDKKCFLPAFPLNN